MRAFPLDSNLLICLCPGMALVDDLCVNLRDRKAGGRERVKGGGDHGNGITLPDHQEGTNSPGAKGLLCLQRYHKGGGRAAHSVITAVILKP